MGQCSFLLTVLAFRCPLSVYSQIDSGCGIKIVAVFVSAKNTLSRHQPTNPPTQIQEVCQRHLSKTNSHLHQMQATKTISPRRQELRNSAAQTNANKTFSSQRLKPAHHGPENRIQKTNRNIAAIKGPRLYKKQIGTHREKKHVLTLTLMLVGRKSACKTSAGSSKIFRWLAPLLGPNLDPK